MKEVNDSHAGRGWPQRRASFNHDWLKNVYLPALDAWINMLSGDIEDPSFEERFLQKRFREWEARCDEARALVQEFAEEMSPGCLVDAPSLEGFAEGDRAWIRSVVHAAWKARTGQGPLLRQIDESLQAANAAFEELAERLRSIEARSSDDLRPLRDDFADFASRCRELGAAISRLPNRVLVA